MPPRKTAPPIVPAADPPPADTPPPPDAPPKKYGNHGNLPGPGPGRPRKAGPPRNESQHALAAVVVSAEARLDAARVTFATSSLVADELELYLAQIGMASAQAAYMRSQNNHILALKYDENAVRIGRLVSGLRELLATDLLKQLQKRGRKEDALGGRRG